MLLVLYRWPPYGNMPSFQNKKFEQPFKWFTMLGVSNLRHPSWYKWWLAMLMALMSSAVCSQPSHNEICSRQNRPERLGRTLRHMAETAVISMAGGWMLQIGKGLSHLELCPEWWIALEYHFYWLISDLIFAFGYLHNITCMCGIYVWH